jgi:glycoside/pentoside/hexuronide:cation symporter, GPH family
MEIQTATNQLPVSKIKEKLSLKEKLSYGMGDFASNIIWGVVGSFLLYFYTDVALIPVAATGTIFLVSRFLDAFIDPVIGGFIDRTNSKWGRTKPYIMFGIIPLCIFFVLSFTTVDASNTVKIIYAYVTYIIAGILYSVVNVPYGALMSLMTRDTNEKTQLASFRMTGTGLGNILVAVGTMPLVNFLGKGNQEQGFFWAAIIFSLFGIFSFSIILKNCKERYLETIEVTKEKSSFGKTYKSAFKNGPWVSATVFALMAFIKLGAFIAITIYFCLQVLKNPAMISILLPVYSISIIVGSFITPVYLKKFGHRKGNIIALIINILGFLILPLFADKLVIFVIIYFIANVFSGICGGSVYGMIADSVDYNEWKFGIRSEGTLFAGYSFATKVGMAIGGAAVGYVLAFSGYDAKNVTDTAVNSINIVYYAVPIICSVLQIIAVSFYKLDKMHPQIVLELNERH